MMDQLVFQHIWKSQLQSQWEEQTSALFLKSDKPSKILAARSRTSSSNKVSLVSSWSDSEKTQVNGQQSNIAQSSDGLFKITSISELEEFRVTSEGVRFYSVGQDGHSWSRLALTRELFDGLCHDSKNSDIFRNLISHMGSRNADESSPPPPYVHTRDGTQVTYALRYVAKNNGKRPSNPWSIRQFAVYAKSEGDLTQASWIFVALPDDWFRDAVELSRLPGSESSSLTLLLHQLLLQQSLACWRPYLSWLDEQVAECDREISFATPSGEIRNDLSNILLRLRNLENQIETAKCSLQSNGRTVQTFRRLSNIRSASMDNAPTCSSDTSHELNFAEQQTQMILSQLEYLKSKLSSCSQLASSFLVQNIATLSAEEVTKSRHDAATVKALTIVASVFLPTTLVMNFFSTSFVESKASGIVVADQWWLLLAIGVPLTCLVFVVWATFNHFRDWNLKKKASKETSCV